ncbi:hypothetical protein GGP66_000746 [Salinibacter ruber]|uniref:Uncharacterized protein n=1 Tax=Salinibacter ruber TaxID=146919 RepID=A0A9X2UMN2_9BACT|nr:hypothetical protein [Salinibacter ruber]MCS3610505.1 hypothetical protein [Salinibacter ruber]MCS3614651.1 hypothetical protein [Salinibacter ruber]MCS3645561.1 hypothetical protein [Salinibacter ruber]MCS3673334.1 hypothetical protein [Salinibacter ruber]
MITETLSSLTDLIQQVVVFGQDHYRLPFIKRLYQSIYLLDGIIACDDIFQFIFQLLVGFRVRF